MNMTNGYQGTHVLVTGADGFIGSHLTERLYAEGADVTALSLYNAFDCCGWLDTLPEAVRGRIRIERGDMRDPAFVTRLCEGQRVIFHLAALIAIPHSYHAVQSYVDVNVSGAVNLLEAARAHRPRRVVTTSTSEVYGTARITRFLKTTRSTGNHPTPQARSRPTPWPRHTCAVSISRRSY